MIRTANYFQDNYRACCAAFRHAGSRLQGTQILQNRQLLHGMLRLPHSAAADPGIDWLYIGPAGKTERLLLLTSGLHGIEGYAGSALQQLFLNQLLAVELGASAARDTAFLFIHALNPYGFQHNRRTTVENIDLNRNFDTSADLYQTTNPGYDQLNCILNPERLISEADLDRESFLGVLNGLSQSHSERELTEAIARGQYNYERGIYYGGCMPAGQRGVIDSLLQNHLPHFRAVYAIDVHTGYGERGRLHYFPDAQSPEHKAAIQRLFRGYKIDWGDSEGFYSVTGEFVNYIGKLCRADQLYIPMIFEFGTLDSHTPFGGAISVHNMILENQLFHYGSQTDSIAAVVRQRFLEMFYPSDEAWRRAALDQGAAALRRTLQRFHQE
ncbi:MAG: DUF2817 domain-containing protein [Leptospiraceae bacterium]|nr:DUF2817 domain-containing protein [Leptospiraceae bacterium]